MFTKRNWLENEKRLFYVKNETLIYQYVINTLLQATGLNSISSPLYSTVVAQIKPAT